MANQSKLEKQSMGTAKLVDNLLKKDQAQRKEKEEWKQTDKQRELYAAEEEAAEVERLRLKEGERCFLEEAATT